MRNVEISFRPNWSFEWNFNEDQIIEGDYFSKQFFVDEKEEVYKYALIVFEAAFPHYKQYANIDVHSEFPIYMCIDNKLNFSDKLFSYPDYHLNPNGTIRKVTESRWKANWTFKELKDLNALGYLDGNVNHIIVGVAQVGTVGVPLPDLFNRVMEVLGYLSFFGFNINIPKNI